MSYVLHRLVLKSKVRGQDYTAE